MKLHYVLLLSLCLAPFVQAHAYPLAKWEAVRAQVKADLQPYQGKTGIFSYSEDGVPGKGEGAGFPCALRTRLDAQDFPGEPEVAMNLMEAEITGSVPFRFASTGKYDNQTFGPGEWMAKRSASTDTVTYSIKGLNTKGVWTELNGCGSWGHISKVAWGGEMQLVLTPGSIKAVYTYRCELLGGDRHRIERICQF